MKTKLAAILAGVSLCLLGANGVYAQDVLVNKSVVDMHGLGLADTVLIDKIKTSKCNFDTSVDALKALKAAGITGDVMSAMILASSSQGSTASAAPAPTPAAAAAPAGDPSDPNAMHEPGIWVYQAGGAQKMTKLEPSTITKVESGGGAMWGMAWGATAKSRADLNGTSATTQLNSRRPVFYFYFDAANQGNPTDFVLAQMEVRTKDNERRMVVGQMNAYSGSKSGPDQKDVRQVSFDRISPGIYKASPQADLKDGEYAFYYSGSAPIVGYYFVMGAGGKLFDFGIKGN